MLRLPVLPCSEVDALLQSLRYIEAMWGGFGEIEAKEAKWRDAPIAAIDLEELREMLVSAPHSSVGQHTACEHDSLYLAHMSCDRSAIGRAVTRC